MEKDIDIKSSTINKAIDFAGKLIVPPLKETGLLIKDQVSYLRFKNQVKILNKAQKICQENGISTKQVPLKLLAPFMEYSSLEEDETLQDKWAILLSNMVDSEQNIENHVFPYILSQVSSIEFLTLENVLENKKDRIERTKKNLKKAKSNLEKDEKKVASEIKKINNSLDKLKGQKSVESNHLWMTLQNEKQRVEDLIKEHELKILALEHELERAEIIPNGSLKEFELSNLIRHGLLKEVQKISTTKYPSTFFNPNNHFLSSSNIDVHSQIEIVMTELGEMFILACKEKGTFQ